MSALRAPWLAWGAVVALLAYPAQAQIIGQQSSILGGEEGFFRPTGGGGAVLWTPADLGALLALWLDADDASTITLNGTTVSQWNDKSGNARHASQATAANQPTYTTIGLNGKPVISFDGLDDELITTPFALGETAAMVAQRSSIDQPVIEAPIATNRGFWGSVYPGFTTHLDYAVSGGPLLSAPPNSAVTTPSLVSQTGLLQTSTFAYKIGSATPGYLNLNGFIAEVVVTDPLLSTADRQKLEGYLAWKWGIEADLPADHPHKSAPPTTSGASTVTIDAMPYTRTVTCDTYTVTGYYTGTAPTTWSASPSGDTGSCTDLGSGTFSCVVDVDPDASGEGVETITIGNDSVDIGFYVAGSHSCFLAQSVDGSYNSTLADSDPVATWSNLGTSALDVTQATAANQPTFKTAIVGGNPVVRCDGGDRLAAATAANWTWMHDGTDTTVTAAVATTSADPDDLMQLVSTAATVSTSSRGFSLFLDDRASVPRNDLIGVIVSKGSAPASILISSSNNDYPSAVMNQATYTTDDTATDDGYIYVNGGSVAGIAASSTFSASAPVGALTICAGTAGADGFIGDVFAVLAYQSALTATQRSINDAVTAWATESFTPATETWFFVGDSLTSGSGGVTTWPTKLAADAPSTALFTNRASGGATSAQILAQWRLNKNVSKVFVLGGINDIAVGTSATTAFTSLSAIYSEAATLGVDVIAMPTLPFGNAASWSAADQTQLELLEASIVADANVDVLVNFYDLMGEPGTPEDLAAIYDNGDGVHPNETGTTFMAAEIATALGL